MVVSSFVTVSWAFSTVGDWMMNPLSTSTACTAIVNSSQRYRTIIGKAIRLILPG